MNEYDDPGRRAEHGEAPDDPATDDPASPADRRFTRNAEGSWDTDDTEDTEDTARFARPAPESSTRASTQPSTESSPESSTQSFPPFANESRASAYSPASGYGAPPGQGQQGYGQHGYGQQGYAQPQQHTYRHPAAPWAGPGLGSRRPPSRVPGWLWPVVAATALVVGLLGGTIGGAAVFASLGAGGPTFDGDNGVAAPLEPENGSVAAVAEQLLPSTVQILARTGQGGATGSGFVIDTRGHVITNNHVVADAAASGRIQVIDHQGRTHPADIVGRSPVYDIAVLEIEDAGDLRPAALGSSRSMRVGETVVAIGSPLGLDSTVTSGIVSALDRPVTTGDEDDSSFINAVQTDAAINPGNSGGPLVNLRGEVVGVNSAIATMGGGFGGESGNIGVGFAIPMEQVKITATQILETGEAQYPVIGANVNTGSRRNGAEVVAVPSGTPADRAGLRKGDIVVAVDDVAVTDGIGLIVAIRSHRPGDTVALEVRRDGEEMTLKIELDGKTG